MGWKSTIDITRAEAKRLILQKLVNLDQMSDRELADMTTRYMNLMREDIIKTAETLGAKIADSIRLVDES